MGQPPVETAELFRVEPERFVAERDALVKRLRADGRDDDAAAVKALRKPTAVVWALNQLASREPEGLQALFDAGRELRAAQQAALAGKGSDDLLAATSARRSAIATLVRAATAVLEEAGHRGGNQPDAIAAALEVASADPTSGAQLAAGMLERAPTSSPDLGFGDVPMIASVPGGASNASDEGPSRTDLARLRREREAAEKSARTKRSTADRLARQVDDLASRLEQLKTQHAASEAAALEAELEAERATRRVDEP